jgi:Carboxypeptidase regulatory-like domain
MKTTGALLLCLASLASAAVDGTVTNRTTGKPQPGATVTLYKLSQNGLESVESVKSDAAGNFRIDQNLKGPRLLQSAYDGVTYNHMLPPGSPETGVALEVYNSTKQPGAAKVMQHMLILEPSGSDLAVSEGFIWLNTGKTTFQDLDAGTLKFYAPPGAKGIQVNATAPQGMPIRTAPAPAGQPDVYKVVFPIKPGETNIHVNYTVPFASPGKFEGRALYKGGPTSIIVPEGVSLKGEGLESRGVEPRTKASIYQTNEAAFKVEIEGSGELKRGEPAAESEQSGPQIQFVLPKLYDKLYWVLALSFSILLLGFVLLYRAGQATTAPSEARAQAAGLKKK